MVTGLISSKFFQEQDSRPKKIKKSLGSKTKSLGHLYQLDVLRLSHRKKTKNYFLTISLALHFLCQVLTGQSTDLWLKLEI